MINFFVAMRQKFLIVFLMFIFFLVFFPATASVPARQQYENGLEAQEVGDWFTAVEFYHEAIRLNEVYGDAWYGLAECTYALGEYSLALSYLDTAEIYAKDKTEILNLRGFCYLGLEKVEEAETLFRQVLSAYPNNIEARFGLAQLDILEGRLSGAESLYLDALKRQQSNRNALLSVALVAQELGKSKEAETYIQQALRYHSSDAEVQYVAAWISFLNGNLQNTEYRVRTSVNLNPKMDKSYELLAAVLFEQGRYQDAIDVCDYRLNNNRTLATAWYLKGRALQRLGRVDEAYSVFETGLSVVPEDELMRTALELIVLETFDIEDSRRAKWAQYHITKASEHEKLYEAAQAEFEYKNALRLDPLNTEARAAYAATLDRKGQQELYLEQLTFISNLQPVSVKVMDTIEAYKSLLSDTLAVRWNVDPFYLDKTRWSIGIYPYGSNVQLLHADASLLTVKAIEQQFSGITAIDAKSYNDFVTYSEAFRLARTLGQDYFVLVEFEENDRELLLKATVYSGRNGTEANSFKFYRTGNDRYAGALRRLCTSISNILPVRGLVIDRNADDVLVDLGTSDGIEVGSELTVVKAGQLYTPDKGMGLEVDEKNILGTIKITQVSESVSQGRYSRKGFFDRMNINDEVMISPEKIEDAEESLIPSVQEISGSEYPVLARMLQEIYLIQ
ncbi:MAG: tetratricopeptide repeat protein [Spirochaetaceae bacterium]|nr:tetratricopeptide repeat protein [Spirochaetaceae bacterium]